jgi:hypothetical protein
LELAGTLCLISWSQNALLTASFSQKFCLRHHICACGISPRPKGTKRDEKKRTGTKRDEKKRGCSIEVLLFSRFFSRNHETASLPPLSSDFDNHSLLIL